MRANHRTASHSTMHIEAAPEQIWEGLATARGMNTYLTDEVHAPNEHISEGDEIRIVIGDMINDAVCLASDRPRLFRLKDRFRSLLADDSYVEYELVTTFRLEEEEHMTRVTVEVDGYDENSELHRWVRECGEFGWKQSLFNLKLVLELGLDLRYDVFGYPRFGVCNYTATPAQLRAKGLDPDRVQGNYLMEVFPEGPAARAGLRPGDIVVSFGGRDVPTYAEFIRSLGLCAGTNGPVGVTYYREGCKLHTEAALSYDKLLTGLVDPTEESVRQVADGKRSS
ncbi:PDZ domain-containing protein [Paenibacillus oleatilyticus]|uniref:PDZ domain-containing protein n=1 Tax=Paenibacillus oleatilyticus TaxID=2594886 RepID=A0ABV4UX81_9BACL